MMEQSKNERIVELVVISDVHLGTYGCHAKELLHYLKSIKPNRLVLNGDIVDIWQFNKRYWPKSHMKVIKHLLKLVSKGVEIYYVTGNHDEMLRKFSGFTLGSFHIVDKVVLDLDNHQKAWIFHGDVFDFTMQHAKWLAKLGAVGYDILILINRFVNFISEYVFRKKKISLSKRIKSGVKSAVKFINDFEQTAANIGIANHYDFVVCGHIHQPNIRKIGNQQGEITYLNSGDWVENLTALEYNQGSWNIIQFNEISPAYPVVESTEDNTVLDTRFIFQHLLQEFTLMGEK